ncbi:MAG: hypothetical protein E8A46_04385 [Bradyrhizobium sp.]|uniref:hypothetical protein n=1 Tax=Bradyrhizobium sp. TaxID=376 RepID=UPI0011FD2FD4|nr:hypothetical protein [Bradyrhizobium sp.]THD56019.1 MAG: hypothetical protein E8A46_04385 [Bradyrhizobium sp.]
MIAQLRLEVAARPAWGALVIAMERLPRCQRVEIALMGRRAKAAKHPRLRRLAREAKAEAKRLAGENSLVSDDTPEAGRPFGATVQRAREEVAHDEPPETRVGRDGKSYPATQKPKQHRGGLMR